MGDMGGENVMVRNAVSSWRQVVGQVDKTIGAFGDEELQREVAPGRNRVYYLLGHLTAVHDRLFATLRLGERLHSELDEAFIVKADKTDLDDELPAAELRKAWREVNDKLTAAMEKLSAEQWLERHDSVSAEDFAKEPWRNRLAVLLSRTTHAAMHEGQMRLAGKK
ncbi:MAG TPA: DinB family protein [Candidatus Acidoferrum sp.]|nr:DinB family protein [Candidatus Acidoferrum sp.]